MEKNLIARATTSIEASRRQVWAALVAPEAIKQYMFGAEVTSDWRPGSQITWRREVQGMPCEDKGTILKFERDQLLQYSHYSPLSGQPDTAQNYHTVSIRLSSSGGDVEVSLSQDKNADERTCQEIEQEWDAMLDGLKAYVEKRTLQTA